MRVQDKKLPIIIFLIIGTFFYSNCKEKETEKTQSKLQEPLNEEKPISADLNNCLKKSDSILIREYNQRLKALVLQNNIDSIEKLVEIPFNSEGEKYSKEEFLTSFYDLVKQYYFVDLMNEDDRTELKREEYYSVKDDETCFLYSITNDFPEQEFNIWFYLDKIDGEIKLVKIMIAG